MSIDWDHLPSIKSNLGKKGYRIYQKCEKNFECIGSGDEAVVYRVPKGILKITTGEWEYITKNIVGKKLSNVGEVLFAKHYDDGYGFSIVIMKEYSRNAISSGAYIGGQWWNSNIITQRLFWVLRYKANMIEKHPEPLEYSGVEFNEFVTNDLINDAWFTFRKLRSMPVPIPARLSVNDNTMQDIVDMLTANVVLNNVSSEWCCDSHYGNFCRDSRGRLCLVDW